MSIVDVLVKQNKLDRTTANLVKQMTESGDVSVEQALISNGVRLADITGAKGEFLGIPVRAISEEKIPFEILEYIPEESAQHYHFVPIGFKDGALEVGIVDPDNIAARDALTFIAGKKNVPYKVYLISPEDLDKVLEMYKGLSGEVSQALTELESELSADLEQQLGEKRKQSGQEKESEALIIEDAPVVKIVATIVRYATEGDASDVHVEPLRDKVRVRFRVDGVLNTSLVLPIQIHAAVVARIKVLSNMKLDEKRKPQDGRFSARIEGRRIDFRVSTFPTAFGEKVVMRILDQEKGVKKLDDIGFTPENLALVREAINKPYGLILITGPTGSGKSTTLYSMLNAVDRESMNVLSLEDPVEYNIEGVSQSQVRPEIDYTFANGLRSTLRQDPDVIMVGEIRDKETAQLAVQAALTGHLVFSTLHTNNSAGVIPRLIDMGVDPYLIAPTLVLTIAQRLVSLLCPGGGKKVPVDGAIKAIIDQQFDDLPSEFRRKISIPDHVMEIMPTPECPKGTRGRMAVFEVFKMDKDVEAQLLKSPTELEISELLRKKGMLSLKEDAILKAFSGLIPFEEVNKL